MTYSVKCIKCGIDYQSVTEGDEDYCASCRTQQIALAKEIDAKVAERRKNAPPPTRKVYEPVPGTNRVEINYRNL
jgi:hypothetical protein